MQEIRTFSKFSKIGLYTGITGFQSTPNRKTIRFNLGIDLVFGRMYLTNRFRFSMRVYRNRSQRRHSVERTKNVISSLNIVTETKSSFKVLYLEFENVSKKFVQRNI